VRDRARDKNKQSKQWKKDPKEGETFQSNKEPTLKRGGVKNVDFRKGREAGGKHLSDENGQQVQEEQMEHRGVRLEPM